MALALPDSLVADPLLDEADLMRRFVDWHRGGSYSFTGRCFDIGVTAAQALARFERGGDPVAGSTDPMSAGNGSLMRLAPVVLRRWRDLEMLAGVAARQSRTTHGAPEAVAACVAYADMLADAARLVFLTKARACSCRCSSFGGTDAARTSRTPAACATSSSRWLRRRQTASASYLPRAKPTYAQSLPTT